MVEEISLSLGLPIVLGIIIGIIEAYFIYQDESMVSGKDFLGDMWHGILFCVFGVLVASNVPYIVQFIPENFHGLLFVNSQTGNSIVISIFVVIFMLLKMVASHSIKGISGRGFQEKFWHKLVIALAVGFAPYYIDLLREPLRPILDKLPNWV